MPAIFLAQMILFFHGLNPVYWLVALPLLLVLGFMTTLAEIHDRGNTLQIKRWWRSWDVRKADIVRVSPTLLDDVHFVQLRQFVPPWGKVYFWCDWSSYTADDVSHQVATNDSTGSWGHSMIDAIAPIALAVSGFICARALRETDGFRIETASGRVEASVLSAAMCVVFLLLRKRRPSFANALLFWATCVVGLVHW